MSRIRIHATWKIDGAPRLPPKVGSGRLGEPEGTRDSSVSDWLSWLAGSLGWVRPDFSG